MKISVTFEDLSRDCKRVEWSELFDRALDNFVHLCPPMTWLDDECAYHSYLAPTAAEGSFTALLLCVDLKRQRGFSVSFDDVTTS